MAWRIERQADGRYAIWSSRLGDYIVIDAEPERIERIYAEKGARVYLASARSQIERGTPVSAEGEAKIEASRKRGHTPAEDPDAPIGSTGVRSGEIDLS